MTSHDDHEWDEAIEEERKMQLIERFIQMLDSRRPKTYNSVMLFLIDDEEYLEESSKLSDEDRKLIETEIKSRYKHLPYQT